MINIRAGLRALLIHKGTKLLYIWLLYIYRLRALLIHKGTKHVQQCDEKISSLRALLIHKGTKLSTY